MTQPRQSDRAPEISSPSRAGETRRDDDELSLSVSPPVRAFPYSFARGFRPRYFAAHVNSWRIKRAGRRVPRYYRLPTEFSVTKAARARLRSCCIRIIAPPTSNRIYPAALFSDLMVHRVAATVYSPAHARHLTRLGKATFPTINIATAPRYTHAVRQPMPATRGTDGRPRRRRDGASLNECGKGDSV